MSSQENKARENVIIPKEKAIRIATAEVDITISSSFENDNLKDIVRTAERIANKYNKPESIRKRYIG